MKIKDKIGSYFGIEVEIVARLNHYALVRYQGREFIVDTADLISSLTLAKAA